MVKDSYYYEVLNVAPNADDKALRIAYRRQAILHHPDKSRDDKHANQRFHEISEAYRILSDSRLRAEYDRHGRPGSSELERLTDEEGNERFFQNMIGADESFRDWIGDLHFTRKLADMMGQKSSESDTVAEYFILEEQPQSYSSAHRSNSTAIIKSKTNAPLRSVSRAEYLASKLLQRMRSWLRSEQSIGDRDSFKTKISREAEALSLESFGIDLIHLIGKTYISKAAEVLDKNRRWSLFSYFSAPTSSVADGAKLVSNARKLQKTINTLVAADKKSPNGLDPELEHRAMQDLIALTWEATQMDVRSILRETCDLILYDRDISTRKQRSRADALDMIGEVFCNVQPTRASERAKDYYFDHLTGSVPSFGQKKRRSSVASFDSSTNPPNTSRVSSSMGARIGSRGPASSHSAETSTRPPVSRVHNDAKSTIMRTSRSNRSDIGMEGFAKP